MAEAPQGAAAPSATPATGAPDAAPATAAAPAAAAQEFIQVPKEAFKDYGGDWHRVKADLNAYREAKPVLDQWNPVIQELVTMGLTPQQAVERWNATISETPAPVAPNPAGQGQPAGDTPLTVAAYQKLQEERDAKFREQAQAQQAMATEQMARTAETNEAISALREHNLQLAPDGNHPPEVMTAWWLYHHSLTKAREEMIGPYTPNREQAMKAQASPQMLARAKELFRKQLADVRNALVVQQIAGQSTLPATLGGGASGAAPVDPAKMTPDQRAKYWASGQVPG